MREWLPALAYDRPVTSLMAFVALLVVGFIAYARIPIQMMPAGFEPRFLWVQVPYANASPIEVDEQIVRPVEAQLGTVSGIKSLRSNADSGSAGFGVEFYSSVDMDVAYNAVVDRMERAMAEMPEGADRYWVYKFNPDDNPIIWAGVSLPDTVDDPYFVMNRIVQPRLQRVSGVASIDVWGVPDRAVYIDFDKERVGAHGINLGDVQRKLSADNFQMSGGEIRDGGQVLYVRSIARLEDVEELRRFPIADGLVLADIADVTIRSTISGDINRINGADGAALAIKKESSANTVAVCEAIQAALDELEADPRLAGAEFFVFFDQGELIADSVDTLLGSALTGGLFAVVILFVFLREWRMTLLIALSIPFSLLITIGVLYFRGDSMNLLSMMGLMLAVGMVVDNAIVVIETIYRRRADGASLRAAAIDGAAEVNLAIVMSTLTTMVVFLPLILMSESVEFSFFMGVLGFPVIFALGASLIVALFFAPLATRYVGSAQVLPDPGWLQRLQERYARALAWVLAHRADSAALLIGMTFLTVVVPVRGVQCSASSDGNLNDFTVRFTVPPDASPLDRDRIVGRLEQAFEEHREEWGIRVYRSRLGSTSTNGRLYVYLETDDPPMGRDDVMKAAKQALPDDIPGVVASIGWEGGSQGGGNSIGLQVAGEDMGTLVAIAREVVRRAETVDGVMAAHLDFENTGAPEIRLHADREQLARYGLTASSVGQTVAYAMRGSRLQPLRQGERELDVASRFELEDRSDLDTLLDFPVWSPATMGQVPLRALTDIEMGRGPEGIRRQDRRTSVEVTVDLEQDVPVMEAHARLDAALQDMALPRGYTVQKGQRFEMQLEDDQARNLALLLSVTFVFLLMGVLFESFVLPLTVITTIPMAAMGAFWGLWVTNTPMDTMAGIGLVILVGVVVNNGIVLIDLVTQLRAEGLARDEALVEAGRRRLRPILMTALTTIFGLVPMALGSSAFVGIPYAPLGRIVIGGMTAATLLTLVFVPYLYTVLDDVREAGQDWLTYVRTRSRRPA